MSDIFDEISEPKKDIFDDVGNEPTVNTGGTVKRAVAKEATGILGGMKRLGQQLYNKTIADTLQYVSTHNTFGKMDTDIKAGEVIEEDRVKGLKRTPHEIMTEASQRLAAEVARRYPRSEPSEAPIIGGHPDIDKAIKSGIDIVSGVGSFVAQVGVFTSQGIPSTLAWELVTQANGGKPGTGAVNAAIFHGVGLAPLTKTGRSVAAGTIMAGQAKLEGASNMEAAQSGLIPLGFQAAGALKGRGPKVPRPDIVRRLAPELPEIKEPPAVATAEATIPGREVAPQDPAVTREHTARLQGEWERELEAENRAYEQLQEAIGTGDQTQIKRAQTRYDKARPLQREFLQQMSDSGDPDATARLGAGLFMPDDVAQTTPLTAQERSAAKRMGFGKTSTGRQGWESPGRIRLALRQASGEGDQGSTLGVLPAKPAEGKAEAKPEAKVEPSGHPAQPEKKTELDADVELADRRLNDLVRSTPANKAGEKRLNVWASARYVLRQFDAVSGTKTADWIERIDRRANVEAPEEATQKEREIMQKHGFTGEDVVIPTGDSATRIGEALHSGDISKLTPDELKYHVAAKELLEYGGELAARRKWQMWKNGTEVPGGIEGDAGMAKEIMADGKRAEADGKLDEWLKTQPWASRETYFMSERPQDAVADDPELLFREGSPTISGREAKTRKGDTKARKTDNLFADIHDHLLRLARSEAANDEIPQIWRRVKAANIDSRSKEAMKDLLKNVAGVNKPSYGAEQLAIAGKLWFWRLKFLNPRFVYRFTVQNLTQLLYMKTQMSTAALARGSMIIGQQKYAGTRDTFRVKEGEKLWGQASRQNQMFVAQLRDAGNEFRQNHPEVWRMSRPVVNLVDRFVHASSFADPMVREMSWHVYFSATKDYLTRFQKGEITWKQVEKNVQLKTLHPAQAKEAYRLIKKGEIDRAASLIAEDKTSATHARYEITQRSLVEQTKTGRLVTGPLTYIRSLYEMAWHQGLKPLDAGLKAGDYDMAWRGTKNILFLGVGYYLAAKMFEKSTGRFAPMLAGVLIGRSPGIDFVIGPLDDAAQASFEAESKQLTTAQTADLIASKLSNRLEQTLPLADVMVDYYEKQHDLTGVHMWGIIKSKLNHKWQVKYKKQWKPAERNALEGWAHLLIGGYEEGIKRRERQARKQEVKGL